MNSTDSSEERLRAIARSIEDPNSPVGIDAKRTHVLILHALERIQERLTLIEDRLEALSPRE